MDILDFELIKYANMEIFVPIFAILVILSVFIFFSSLKKLVISIIIFHILVIIIRLVYYFLDLNSLNSLSVEINQSNAVDFLVEVFNIQTLKLFVYMVFTLVSIILIALKSLRGNN